MTKVVTSRYRVNINDLDKKYMCKIEIIFLCDLVDKKILMSAKSIFHTKKAPVNLQNTNVKTY